jgi:16S rRNA A1518/A1519 N6-dimethyltransferase RsmA/KsgA/DIM1 with predicted DNA glycosylase/AP lyase activity
MMKWVKHPDDLYSIAGATFLVSQQSAQEMTRNSPPRRKLGILTNALFQTRIVKTNIEKRSFWPRPRTTSAIVKLVVKSPEELSAPNFLWYYLLSRPGWKVKNALREGLISWSQKQQRRIGYEKPRKKRERQLIKEQLRKMRGSAEKVIHAFAEELSYSHRGSILAKNQARESISKLELPTRLLETQISQLDGTGIERIDKAVFSLLKN